MLENVYLQMIKDMTTFIKSKLGLVLLLMNLSFCCYSQENIKTQTVEWWPFDIEISYTDIDLKEVRIKNAHLSSVLLDTIMYQGSRNFIEIGTMHLIVEDWDPRLKLYKLNRNEYFNLKPKGITIKDSLYIALYFIKSKRSIKRTIKELKKSKNYYSLKNEIISKEIFNHACILSEYMFTFQESDTVNLK